MPPARRSNKQRRLLRSPRPAARATPTRSESKMPSDLQRVARGLVECLDEVPQVVAHLQRTAARCRENAAMSIAASRGQATTAAMQLDAAAHACEEAAHYLAMAPPKAKAWAERLVGSNRPSQGFARG